MKEKWRSRPNFEDRKVNWKEKREKTKSQRGEPSKIGGLARVGGWSTGSRSLAVTCQKQAGIFFVLIGS